nr:sigma 54-interacting transcriptional regulator [Candidatus Wallbacteria bacterium]
MNERSLVIITNKNFSKTNDSSLELKDFLEKLNDKKQILDKNDDSIRQKLSRKIKVINFKNIDEFEKNACSIINETGLILYDISVDISPGKRGILENLNDTIKNCLSDESLIKYPPVGFIADKFRIKILEEQVISPDYPKFIGIFSYGGLYDHSFISLIDNFLNLSIDDLKTSKIGETCKTEIDTAEELTTFFNKRKFSSLFIGKNREELLRLRTELINKKDSLISWRNSPLVEEIKNNSDFLKDFYKNLTPGKDFNDDEMSIFKKNDDEKWSGFSILILGDTGTGKTLVSEWISSFIGMLVSENNNIAVNQFNCANLTEELFDSGFFGILKGQATSVESRYGKILESIGKVMFLDEVAELL